MIFLIQFLPLIQLLKADESNSTAPPGPTIDQFVPLGSTTAFMCDPSYSTNNSKSTWYRNGKPIATVDSHSNANYQNRTKNGYEETMPQVGFLTIYNVSKEDRGTYWCQRDSDKKIGDIYKLDVGFVDQIVADIKIEPVEPMLGRQFIIICPVPNANPPPKITWLLNGLPMSHISSDYSSYSNGTLIIHHFSYQHFGIFECQVTNFAGKSYAQFLIDSDHIRKTSVIAEPINYNICSAAFKNSLFMFLMGCLVTSSAVLLYLSCAIFILRPDRPRRILRPSFWSRTDPRLAPGFRKAVVPLPDCFVNINTRMLPNHQ